MKTFNKINKGDSIFYIGLTGQIEEGIITSVSPNIDGYYSVFAGYNRNTELKFTWPIEINQLRRTSYYGVATSKEGIIIELAERNKKVRDEIRKDKEKNNQQLS